MRILIVLTAAAGIALLVAGTAAVMAEGPTTTELDGDILVVQKWISEAEEDAAKYGSGVIRSYAALRVQILKNTEAMLQQKRLSLIRKITLVYHDNLPRVALDVDLTALDQEIAKAEKEQIDAEIEARRYSGGLIQAMSLVRVAIAQTTIAALEQQKLLSRYGMPMLALPRLTTTPEKKQEPPGVVAKDKDAL